MYGSWFAFTLGGVAVLLLVVAATRRAESAGMWGER
jgi:hypothetical protein